MKFRAFLFVIAVLLSLHTFAQQDRPFPSSHADLQSQRASAYLRNLQLPKPSAAEPVSQAAVLSVFYQPCDFELAWTANDETTPAARAVMEELRHADLKGASAPKTTGSPRRGSRACALTIQRDESALELVRFDMVSRSRSSAIYRI